MTKTKKTKKITRKRQQRGHGIDIQKWIGKTGIEFHWPGYQYMGPGTKLKHRHAKRAGVIFSIDWVAWGRTGC